MAFQKDLTQLLDKYKVGEKTNTSNEFLAQYIMSSINSLEGLVNNIIKREEVSLLIDEDKFNDNDFVEEMYKLYPSKCPKRQSYLGKTQKDKDRIKKLLKKYSKEDIERVIRNEIDTKYGISYMQNFSTFLNNFPDPQTIEFKSINNVQNDSEGSKQLIINGQLYR